MPPLIQLNELGKTMTHFRLVAVVVGMEDMRTVVRYDGSEAVVRTLHLQDGSGERAVELGLWDSDCVRTSSLRVLDIVHVTEAAKITRTHSDDKADVNNRSIPNYSVRITLKGPTAAVRLVSDAVASAPCDDVSRAANKAKAWRDTRFKVVSSMRRRGAVWTHDSPGHGRHLRRPRILMPVRDTAVKPNNANVLDIISRRHVNIRNEKITHHPNHILLDDVRRGKCPASVEVPNVHVTHVLVRTSRARCVATGCVDTARALQAGCSRRCGVCGRAAIKSVSTGNDTEVENVCRRCGGEISWGFGPVVVLLKDESCQVAALVTDEDVARLLLGVRADVMRHDHRVANWCAAVLHALVVDVGPFTALVAPRTDSTELHGADLILKRLIV